MQTTYPEISKSNSSYGTWAVRVSAIEIKFFWRKRDAVAFVAGLAK